MRKPVAGTRTAANRSGPMPKDADTDLITRPFTPTAKHGVVVVKDPPEAAMSLSPDAAEISGLRLVDAADRARKRD